jgi:phytoene dehydrogenase-like protein
MSILADFVTPPSRFPGLGIPPLNVENAFDLRVPRRASSAGRRPGYHFIRGGCGKLANAMANVVRQHGGRIYTSATIEKIRIDADSIRGVVLSGGHTEDAEIIIATGGARETFFGVVGREYLPAGFAYQIDELPLMESVLMVHLGIDMDPRPYQPEPLAYHYGTYDIEGGIDDCLHGAYHEGHDGFVLYVPSMHSPGLAPEGHHAVTIYTIAPNRLATSTWQSRRRELVSKLIAQAETVIPNLREHIVTQVALTPEDFRERTHQQHHAFGGRAPIMGIEGPGPQTPLNGLWFVGSQSKSGGGVQNVMTGAKDAAQRIMRQQQQQRRRRRQQRRT